MTEQTEKIKVLIVDDHQVVRQGLRTFLELHEDIVVVGEAGDGMTAVEMVRQLEPDVVLMDLVMPRLDGIAATRELKSKGLPAKVIALTSFTEDDKVIPAIQAGASSYLLKDVSPDDLVEAIRAVHRGEARLHPDIAHKLMEQVAHQASPASAAPGRAPHRTRTRGHSPGGAGTQQRGNRTGFDHQRQDRQDAHQQCPEQTRSARPHAVGDLCHQERPG